MNPDHDSRIHPVIPRTKRVPVKRVWWQSKSFVSALAGFTLTELLVLQDGLDGDLRWQSFVKAGIGWSIPVLSKLQTRELTLRRPRTGR